MCAGILILDFWVDQRLDFDSFHFAKISLRVLNPYEFRGKFLWAVE
jgi:hypothetical protein